MMPIGVPITVATITIISEPTMALPIPPTSFGAGMLSVKTWTPRPWIPSMKVSHRIQNSQTMPEHMARKDSVRAMVLTVLRLLNLATR